MKTLITAEEVRSFAKGGAKILKVDEGAIVTPAAWDEARELAIDIVTGASAPTDCEAAKESAQNKIDPEFLAKVVGEVIACLQGKQAAGSRDHDPSGLRLVRGDQLVYTGAATGGIQDPVRCAEVIGGSQSKQVALRAMKMEDASFSHESDSDATLYITAGKLDCTVQGRKYCAAAGDTIFIPARRKVVLATADKANFLIAASVAG